MKVFTSTISLLLLFICGTYCHILNNIFGRDNIALTKLSRQEKCTVSLPNGNKEEGICKTKTECLLTGGIPRGHCGLLSTCCSYTKSCGRTSNAKVSYFNGGLGLKFPELCTYNVLTANENICQLKLNFLAFHTTPPSNLNNERQCAIDNFYVTPSKNIPQICGYNTGQHIYIDVIRSNNITLTMKIGPNSNPQPYWNIKITQLECPRKESIFNKIDKELVNDYNYLAPTGCLQYFTETSGVVRSFGFDSSSTANVYVSNQRYSMCFKRHDNICGVTLTVNTIDFDPNCVDYLLLSGYLSSGKICTGNAGPLEGNPPGPIHLDFIAGVNQNAMGFDMTYRLNTCI